METPEIQTPKLFFPGWIP